MMAIRTDDVDKMAESEALALRELQSVKSEMLQLQKELQEIRQTKFSKELAKEGEQTCLKV